MGEFHFRVEMKNIKDVMESQVRNYHSEGSFLHSEANSLESLGLSEDSFLKETARYVFM